MTLQQITDKINQDLSTSGTCWLSDINIYVYKSLKHYKVRNLVSDRYFYTAASSSSSLQYLFAHDTVADMAQAIHNHINS